MASSELLVIVIVALLVFNPRKLPMLAQHLAKFLNFIQKIKQEAEQFWQARLKEQQLLENEEKAKRAEGIEK